MPNFDIRSNILQETHAVKEIVWSDRFCVNHEEMDEHHQYLVALVNQLIVLANRSRPNAAQYENLLEELGEYIRLHLLREEQLMASANYPFLRQHQNQHAQFIAKIALYIAKNRVEQVVELVEFVRSWLVEHILIEDMKYKNYL